MWAEIDRGKRWGQNALRQHFGTYSLLFVMVMLLTACSSRTSPAPITHLPAGEVRQAASAVKPAPKPLATTQATGTHTVVAGDTLYSIARRYGVSLEDLAQLNQITDPSQMQTGQVLRLSKSSQTNAPVKPAARPVEKQPTTPPRTPSRNQAATAPRASDAKVIRWNWPAQGRILQQFNVNTKGIDLEGKIGDPVKAAADGTVMYAGNGVRGLGNLILLGHTDGFISAYAHNQVLLVKTGQQVKQGAQIASIGQTDTTSPRLHFEIRRRGTPVNPLSYLPAR